MSKFTVVLLGSILTAMTIFGVAANNHPIPSFIPEEPLSDAQYAALIEDREVQQKRESEEENEYLAANKKWQLPDLTELRDDSIVIAYTESPNGKGWNGVRFADLEDKPIEFFWRDTFLSAQNSPHGVLVAKPEITLEDVEEASRTYDPENWRMPKANDVVFVFESTRSHWQSQKYYELQDVEPDSKVIFQGVVYKIRFHESNPTYARIERTNQVVSKVTALHSSIHKDDIVELAIEFGDSQKQDSIIGSYDHPFFVKELNDYLPMGELQPGMELETSDGSPAQVVSIEQKTGTVKMYNLSVLNQNNYFVGTNNPLLPSVLTHNINAKTCDVTRATNSATHAKHLDELRSLERTSLIAELKRDQIKHTPDAIVDISST